MPSQGSKSPLAPSSKTHTFLRKSIGESPLIKTTRTSVPVKVRTSQYTNESNNDESDLPGEDSREFVIHPMRMRTISLMTTNPQKRKQLLIF